MASGRGDGCDVWPPPACGLEASWDALLSLRALYYDFCLTLLMNGLVPGLLGLLAQQDWMKLLKTHPDHEVLCHHCLLCGHDVAPLEMFQHYVETHGS